MKSSEEQMELVARYLEGRANADETSRLEALMLANTQLRVDFLSYARVDAMLPRATGEAPELIDFESRHRPKHLWWTWGLIASAAAGLVMLLGVWRDGSEEEAVDDGVAVVARAVGAEWKDDSLLPGDSVAPGRLDLLKGVVELEFYSGASVILEAPAALEVHTEYAGTLHYGKLRAQVPVQAQGFTIRTREIELVDLGTEFAMEVAPETGTAVHVLDGKVELLAPDKPTKELVAGQGQLVDPSGKRSEITPDPSRFVSREELAKRVRELRDQTHQRWLTSSANLKEDLRLVAYYDFQPLAERERILPNLSPNSYPGLDGAVVGAQWKW
ncbi:MAG: hypothetical protein AAF585_15675, partial [Verrucomicrobiota bacterium]